MIFNPYRAVFALGLLAFMLLPFRVDAGPKWKQQAKKSKPTFTLQNGKGSFPYSYAKGDPNKSVTVYYQKPTQFNPKTSPILFVMHGMSRNGKSYRDSWAKYADRYGALLLCPTFSKDQWPKSDGYNLGNRFDRDGSFNEKGKWSFTIIEALFDDVVTVTGSAQKTYLMYGHSAGGQFVHRFCTFMTDARVAKAVTANAGWYTLADLSVEYPYRCSGARIKKKNLRKVFEKNLIVLLGDRDTDPKDKNLRNTTEARRQGPHRFARGKYYFENAKQNARKIRANFKWVIRTVPGIKHSNPKMAKAAAPLLLDPKKQPIRRQRK